MKRFFAKSISLMLILSMLLAIPAFAEEAETNEQKLDIEQHQFMRGANGLTEFTGDGNKQALMPVNITDTTTTTEYTYTVKQTNGKVSLYENAVDNIVVVENVDHGSDSVSCWFRTIIAVECPEGLSEGMDVMLSCNETDYTWTAVAGFATVNDVRFKLYVAEYKSELKPGEVAPASLYQLWLPAEATSADAALFGPGLDVMVISQCIESGMGITASEALKHLGDISALNHPFESDGWLMTLLKRVFSPKS